MDCDTIWDNASLVTLAGETNPLDIVERGLVAATAGRILYAGPRDDAPELSASRTIDCEDRLMTPGLIDCHTHLVYAGSRAVEWQKRLAGASYEDIARAGGGIVSTMNATRAASEAELMAQSRLRLDALIAEGVTERRMLQVARSLGEACGVNVSTTFLGAHAVPPEYAGRADDYIDLVINEMLPQLAAEGLVDAVDAFCEGIGFTPDQTERVFAAARQLGLPVKLHAEQLSNLHGAALAARHNALSADHLEHLDAEGIAAMASSGTVATLLPGAFYFTRETRLPPMAALREAGVPIAIATDCNPGTSPLTSLLLAMNMAATLFRLTVDECLTGTTRNAALALGVPDVGMLAPGKWADLAVWNVSEPAELVYRMGSNPLHVRYWRGH